MIGSLHTRYCSKTRRHLHYSVNTVIPTKGSILQLSTVDYASGSAYEVKFFTQYSGGHRWTLVTGHHWFTRIRKSHQCQTLLRKADEFHFVNSMKNKTDPFITSNIVESFQLTKTYICSNSQKATRTAAQQPRGSRSRRRLVAYNNNNLIEFPHNHNCLLIANRLALA